MTATSRSHIFSLFVLATLVKRLPQILADTYETKPFLRGGDKISAEVELERSSHRREITTTVQMPATGYKLQWMAQHYSPLCDVPRPRVSISCGDGDPVYFIEFSDSNHRSCHPNPAPNTTNVVCSPMRRGTLYPECHGENRQLHVHMESDGVLCPDLGTTYHYMTFRTFCGVVWEYDTSTCSAIAARNARWDIPFCIGIGQCHGYPTCVSTPEPLDMDSKMQDEKVCVYYRTVEVDVDMEGEGNDEEGEIEAEEAVDDEYVVAVQKEGGSNLVTKQAVGMNRTMEFSGMNTVLPMDEMQGSNRQRNLIEELNFVLDTFLT